GAQAVVHASVVLISAARIWDPRIKYTPVGNTVGPVSDGLANSNPRRVPRTQRMEVRVGRVGYQRTAVLLGDHRADSRGHARRLEYLRRNAPGIRTDDI